MASQVSGMAGRAASAVGRALTGKKRTERFGMVRMEDGTTQLTIADPVDESKLQVTGSE